MSEEDQKVEDADAASEPAPPAQEENAEQRPTYSIVLQERIRARGVPS